MDILRDEDEQRYIYLSGRLNYGSEALGRFNVILSQLPATVTELPPPPAHPGATETRR